MTAMRTINNEATPPLRFDHDETMALLAAVRLASSMVDQAEERHSIPRTRPGVTLAHLLLLFEDMAASFDRRALVRRLP